MDADPRRGDYSSHPTTAGESGSTARAAADLVGSGQELLLFMETGNHGMINMMTQASQAWHQQYEAGAVTTSLRATLWGVLLLEWQARLNKIESDAQALQTAETAGCISRTPLQWVYIEWSVEQKKALPTSVDNLTHENAKQAVANLLRNTAKDGIVHRFQSLKPLRPDMQAEVVVML